MKNIKQIIIVILILAGLYFSLGLFVIQPIGAVPEGTSIVYFRIGLNTSFISSADGLVIKNGRKLSLLNRGIALATMSSEMESRKLFALPYSEFLFNISKKGKHKTTTINNDWNNYKDNSISEQPAEKKINFSVENVRIDKEYKNAWTVKGSIRNNTNSPISGAVKIKFINSSGDIVHSNRAYVNGGDSFGAGRAANFKYTTDPKDFVGVVDFEVIFY